MISKPLDQIAPEDITELRTHGVCESQVVEFKQELPGERGRPDPWIAGGDFTSYARDRLFREIVAFANAQGGTLILGVNETGDEPPRAGEILPVPRVHDLAMRLEEAAHACIDPRLPSLQVRGIVTDGAAGGVLIFRVSPSPLGPHRVAGDGHAFIRRGSRTVKMTMREIQDLTLDLARGAERLDALFAARAAAFGLWLQHSPPGELGAYRITAVPLAPLPKTQRIAQAPAIPGPYVIEEGNTKTDLLVPSHGCVRPIVRGLRLYARDDSVRVDLLESGLVDFWHRSPLGQGLHVELTRFFAAYLSVLDRVGWIRSFAEASDWEFAVELGLAVRGLPHRELVFGVLHNPGTTVDIADVPITFPRVPFRSHSDREKIINLVLRDLLDSAGELREWPQIVLAD
jgi:hypothetical protein